MIETHDGRANFDPESPGTGLGVSQPMQLANDLVTIDPIGRAKCNGWRLFFVCVERKSAWDVWEHWMVWDVMRMM